ncbi:hypothetical protein [Hamadaea tsunoensis]|uniref:hypothetical protein n=1 Tax=Hamadaea tsunoensis TaxID=53368 RepID=UPI00041D07B8|nr:hypothetical protein [Hamadaea tsunoensis]
MGAHRYAGTSPDGESPLRTARRVAGGDTGRPVRRARHADGPIRHADGPTRHADSPTRHADSGPARPVGGVRPVRRRSRGVSARPRDLLLQPTPLVLGTHQAAWLKASLAATAAVVLLIVCGFGSWQILRDERAGTSAAAQGVPVVPTALPRDITSRLADPAPLTASEVFGRKVITIKPGEPGYQVIGVQAVRNCASVADGRLAPLLAAGCTQVVRATLRSPTKAYLATGGIVNLADSGAAKGAYERIHSVVDAKQGRFKGYVPTGATRALALSSTHLGWDYRGHFLVYCVVARADGRDLADDDPYAQQILYDVIELHLLGSVVEKRSVVPVSPGSVSSD